MKTTQFYINVARKGFTAFRKFAPGVILLAFLLGALLASMPPGWPRYLVSSLIFVLGLALYNGYKRDQREERLSEKIGWKMEIKQTKEFPHGGLEGFYSVCKIALLVASLVCLAIILAMIMLIPAGGRPYAWGLLAVGCIAAFP